MNRKYDIRTYSRKNAAKPVLVDRHQLVQLDEINKRGVSSNKLSIKADKQGNVDTSLYDDPFDTTFDRILKNARIVLPRIETPTRKSCYDTTHSSYNISKDKTEDNISLPRISIDFSNANARPIRTPKKVRKKRQATQVIKGTIAKKAKTTVQNKTKSLKKEKNVASKVQVEVGKKETHKTYQLRRGRNNKMKYSMNISRARSVNYNCETSSLDSSWTDDDLAKNDKRQNNRLHSVKGGNKKNAVVTDLKDSVEDMSTKPCSVVLDSLAVTKWKTGEKNIESSVQHSDNSQEVQNGTINLSISNLEYKSLINIKDCVVKIDRLETFVNVRPRNFEKGYNAIISSTPIGKLVRPFKSILLSPISINCSMKLNTLQECTDASSSDSNSKNLVVSLHKKENLVQSFAKNDLPKQDVSKNQCEASSVCIITTLDDSSLNGSLKAESKADIESSVNLLASKLTNSMDLRTASNSVEISVDGVDQQLLQRLTIAQEYNENSTENDLIDSEQINEKKQLKLQLRNVSVDNDISHSLFGDTNESSENCVQTTHSSNSETESSVDNSISQSSKTSNRQALIDSEKSFTTSELSVKDSSIILKVSDDEEIISNTVEKSGSEILLSIQENICNTPPNDADLKPDSEKLKNEHTPYKRTDENLTIIEKLQDSVRITRRRKQYHNWNLHLEDISEDCNGVAPLTKNQLYSDKENQNGDAELNETNSRHVPNFQRTSPYSISDQSVRNSYFMSAPVEKSIFLKPGKQWARSLSILNNVQSELNLEQLSSGKGKRWKYSVQNILDMQKPGVVQSCVRGNKNDKESDLSIETVHKSEHALATNRCSTFGSTTPGRLSKRVSIRVVPNNKTVKCIEDAPFLEAYGIVPVNSQRFTLTYPRKSSVCNVGSDEVDNQIYENHITATAKEVVLKRCKQEEYLLFSEYLSDLYIKHCRKIGEGVYGEVFLYEHEDNTSVIKIIPIEGTDHVNGEPQKKFHEILSEIVISKELHNLRYNASYNTDGFVEVINIKCIRGRYPEKLVELWNIYDTEKRSDNDCPSMFNENQLYIALTLGHAGQDLEAFVFQTADEAYAAFIQAALALAVAEKAVEFEHRDLHWGNMLICRTDEVYAHYNLGNKEIQLPTKGLKVSIIDYTLSRISYQGCSIFNDLESDPALFTADGEYQFEIYRMMRDKVQQNWQNFEPYTNILWLHYTLDKMITAVRYKRKNLKIHKAALVKLTELKNEILSYNSSFDFVLNCDKITNMLCISTKSKVSLPKGELALVENC